MRLNAEETRLFSKVLDAVSCSVDSDEIRRRVSSDLMELVGADYFASYIWSDREKRFLERVAVNMSDDNLDRYEAYYQFHDPITRKMQRHRRAVCHQDVIEEDRFLASEFYNDFLARDGLRHGINLYAYDGDRNIGDLRLWRHARRAPFGAQEKAILNAIRPVFANMLRNARAEAGQAGPVPKNDELMRRFGLTAREAEVAREVCLGRMDEQIAARLNIAFSTVRTHMKSLFGKLRVCNRASLILRIMSET